MSIPAAGATVTLPLHIMAQVGRPGEQVTSLLRWNDGTERTYTTTTLDDGSGHGLLIVTPPWWPDTPPQPASQAAVLELHDAAGALLARQSITVLDPSDARVQQVQVFWTVSGAEVVQPQTVNIVRTERLAAAVLEELLWGPPPATQVGFGTALPVPQEVLAFPGRQADWGTRVTLRSLRIDHDEAHVDLSREMLAFGGGSARVRQIREQITRTLAQFGSLHEVHITVEGREHVLEP